MTDSLRHYQLSAPTLNEGPMPTVHSIEALNAPLSQFGAGARRYGVTFETAHWIAPDFLDVHQHAGIARMLVPQADGASRGHPLSQEPRPKARVVSVASVTCAMHRSGLLERLLREATSPSHDGSVSLASDEMTGRRRSGIELFSMELSAAGTLTSRAHRSLAPARTPAPGPDEEAPRPARLTRAPHAAWPLAMHGRRVSNGLEAHRNPPWTKLPRSCYARTA